jgi:hypothetical protein
VERSLRSDNERTRRLVQRFLITRVCSVCHGTRLRPEALTSQLGGRNIAEISALTLDELRGFTAGLPAGLPAELSRMTTGLLAELNGRLMPVLDVGLSYLTLDRAAPRVHRGAGVSSSPPRCAPAPQACSTCWTSRRLGCTRPTSPDCTRRSPPWPETAIPCSWWSTSGS